MSDGAFHNRVGQDRISSRQIDELVGLARGLAADGVVNPAEVEFLQKWLAANLNVSEQPMIARLYKRVNDILRDGSADAEECQDLLATLNSFADRDFELGEVLKATRLPLCDPAPTLSYPGRRYCFTGTFNYGTRKDCEAVAVQRGATAGSLTTRTDVLVIGIYATESWLHSSFGTKIVRAVDMRENGYRISIVSEEHWVGSLEAAGRQG